MLEREPKTVEQGFIRFLAVAGLLASAVTTVTASAYEVVDSFGKHEFEQPPQRVVVTDWTLLEQLLELGVVPIGAPQLDGYRRLVQRPALADGITDIGLRRSPDLATITALKPDLIILGTDQKQFDRPFSRLTKVMYYHNFSKRFNNGQTSQKRMRQLAALFQKQPQAERKLASIDKALNDYANQLRQQFKGNVPKLNLARLTSTGKALIYGQYSMPGYVLQRLGVDTEFSVEQNKLGERLVPIEQLNAAASGYLLYWQDGEDDQDIKNSAAWRSLPAVQAGRAIRLNEAWSYGGAMSLQYTAEVITEALREAGVSDE